MYLTIQILYLAMHNICLQKYLKPKCLVMISSVSWISKYLLTLAGSKKCILLWYTGLKTILS